MLEVDGIDVFNNVQILWEVSFKAEEGKITTILGPNGAGKTTTVNTIAGLLHPARGEIRFRGERIDRLPPFQIMEKGISLIPEGRELFPKMTVLENLLLGAYNTRARRRMQDSLERIYQLFPVLREKKRQSAITLSGGEQQMLAIARGLMASPKLLILDEPSLGLAPILVKEVFETLERLREEGEVSIILVEQHIYNALKLADKAFVLESGRIVMDGSGEALFNNHYVKKTYLGL
jgi:branched-chain amino acid transport system ATP-binding protein